MIVSVNFIPLAVSVYIIYYVVCTNDGSWFIGFMYEQYLKGNCSWCFTTIDYRLSYYTYACIPALNGNVV